MAALLIKGGTVVNEDRCQQADVYCEHGVIKEVGLNISCPEDVRVIDATDRYVIPGGVDPHTHFNYPFTHGKSADNFFTGTRAALAGGTTCIMDFSMTLKGESMVDCYHRWRGWADGEVCCDYGLHSLVSCWEEGVTGREMEQLAEEEGVSSFKVFMSYKRLMLHDDDIIRVFRETRRLGAVAMVHAENGDAICENEQRVFGMGITGPEGHALCRPEEVETEATRRACVIARQVRCPLFVCHAMQKGAADVVKEAMCAGDVVYSECLAVSLAVDGLRLWDTRWSYAAGHIVGPQLSPEPTNREHLMNYLASDILQMASSDHCTHNIAQKAVGKDDFRQIPNGVNGVEERMSVVWEMGVTTGKMDPCRYVAVTSTNAAKIFGVYPRKGVIAAGSDADIVIWNGTATRTFSVATQHAANDFNVFEGMECHGVPEVVVCGGEVVVDHGELQVTRGRGRYLKCSRFTPHVYSRVQQRDKTLMPRKVDREPYLGPVVVTAEAHQEQSLGRTTQTSKN